MRKLLFIFCILICSSGLSQTGAQSSQKAVEAQSTAFLRTLTPEQIKKYEALRDSWNTQQDPVHRLKQQEDFVSVCRQILTELEYGKLGPGIMDEPTHRAILKFQKAKGIEPTGELNALTFFALSTALDSLPGFIELQRSGSLPKWASTVCFQDSKGTQVEDGWWFVFGPKGLTGIRERNYDSHGRPYPDTIFERVKSPTDVGVFRSTPWKNNQYGWMYANLTIDWTNHTFASESKSANTNETVDRRTGHCRSINIPSN
jgi:hypothetical protein